MTKKKLNLYFQGKGRNFGDVVNQEIFSQLYGCEVKSARPYTADCMAIGSILYRILYDTHRSAFNRQNLKRSFYSAISRARPIHILGSGFIEDVRKTYPSLKIFRPIVVRALRGKHTREIMECILERKLDDIILGDLGILVSRLINSDCIEKKYRLGLAPHMCDKDSELLNEFKQRDDTCILDIESDPLDFLKNMAACETVASSSLHGLIAADSLHIPNLWIKISGRLTGGSFKFMDYYSAYGLDAELTNLNCLDHTSLTPEFITARYRISEGQVEQLKSDIDNVISTFLSETIDHKNKPD